MSATPTNHDGGLDRVIQAGLDYEIEGDVLMVGPVPYRQRDGSVAHGYLICHLEREGERIATPNDHTAHWVADEKPYTADGRSLDNELVHDVSSRDWPNGHVSICGMSRKPPGSGYPDYGQKMLAYARSIARHTGKNWKRDITGTGAVIEGNNMVDQETGLTRSAIGDLDQLFKQEKLAVIGAGGTGGYIVDLIAKCNVASIVIYDDDVVSQHTQLRWPGVVSRRVVEEGQNKAEYLARVYASRTNRNIAGKARRVRKSDLTYLKDRTMVFVAIDRGPDRRKILTGLAELGVNFIDCGIDMHRYPDGLTASARVTRTARDDDYQTRHSLAEQTPGRDTGEDIYEVAIQSGDVNALNATLAVIAWKQSIGFYRDNPRHRRMKLHVASGRWVGHDSGIEDRDHEN